MFLMWKQTDTQHTQHHPPYFATLDPHPSPQPTVQSYYSGILYFIILRTLFNGVGVLAYSRKSTKVEA